MPPKVAEAARKDLDGTWRSRLAERYPVSLGGGVDPAAVRLETLWEVSEAESRLLEELRARPPRTPGDLVQAARDMGARDLFPALSAADRERIAKDGKIPRHEAWAERIRKGDLAVDTLLNLAGLASFAEDQNQLDGRIRRLIG
ncbi:MAG: hypothetical protein HY721_13785 [Planctomycetes bacterium]|nr:hypothetical protein [Planctomycetota bacterium]